jgi:hypothetical protein
MKTTKITIVIISLLLSYNQVNAQFKVVSNGNIGIASGTATVNEALQIGDRWTFHNGGSKAIGYNFKYYSGDLRIFADYPATFRMDATGFKFCVANTGTAGSTISWFSPLIITNMGASSPTIQLTGATTIIGNVSVTGNGTYTGTWIKSDERLKENIKPITNATEILNNLKGKTYNFKSTSNSTQKSYGLIAQEVKEIIPELVKEDDDSLKTLAINYDGLIPILIEAFKEQKLQVEELKSKIENLNSQLNLLKEHNESYLEQNTPNPFSNNTQINFSLPNETKEASIIIFNSDGKLIKKIKITDRGSSNITVDASKLKPGVYSYSLVADGTIINTAKMIINK